MGYCVARGGKLLQMFQDNISVPFERVRLSQKKSVRNCHHSLCNNQEERISWIYT